MASTPERLAASAPAPPLADRVLIEKNARRLTLYAGARPIAVYRVALGFAPVGHKTREGDGRTPEGVYRIDFKNAKSRYHLSLRLSYPDAAARAAARAAGVPPGGDVFIHGTPGRDRPWPRWFRPPDWTAGCIAVTNDEIEEIRARTKVGTRVEIRP